jgi:hypothetical protein
VTFLLDGRAEHTTEVEWTHFGLVILVDLPELLYPASRLGIPLARIPLLRRAVRLLKLVGRSPSGGAVARQPEPLARMEKQ